MEIIEAIGKESFMKSVISFTGGGGKSTSIYRTAEELSSMDLRVLVTTTTMMYHPEVKNRPFDSFFTGSSMDFISAAENISKGSVTVAASGTADSKEGRKLKGWEPEDIERIAGSGIFDTILVEADGAKHLPIKAPGENEPVIPDSTTLTAGVVGLDALDAPATEKTVFRLEYFLKTAETEKGEQISETSILNLVESDQGLFKNSPPGSKKILILNKADIEGKLTAGIKLAEYLMERSGILSKIMVCSMNDNDPVKKVLRKQEL